MRECLCGCKELISDFDSRGRLHLYKNHHGAVGKKYPNRGGDKHSRWKSGRYTNLQGYVMIWSADELGRNKYRAEHRLVVEKDIGRRLTTNEVIHHIDGNRQNNNLDNLELLLKGEHSKEHQNHLRRLIHFIPALEAV